MQTFNVSQILSLERCKEKRMTTDGAHTRGDCNSSRFSAALTNTNLALSTKNANCSIFDKIINKDLQKALTDNRGA